MTDESSVTADVLRRQISYLVHDIAPAIVSFETVLQLIGSGALDLKKESHRKLLENSGASIAFAKLLLENLLEYNYFSEGKVGKAPPSLSWEAFMRDSLALPEILAREKNIQLRLDVAKMGLLRTSNPGILKRVIHNLIINSIKYCPSDSTVRVDLRDYSDRIELVVEDNGPGVPEDKLDSIFEESVQLDLRAQSDFKGVGVGLSFCREAARRLSGSLTVRAVSPHGLRFVLSFPIVSL